MNHLIRLHLSNYINIMKSSNNEPHNIIFCVFVINSLYRLDFLLIIFFFKVPQITFILQ